jgi:tetratricopeptide (TPR) repeat protein
MNFLIPLMLITALLLSACADFLAKPSVGEYAAACRVAVRINRLEDAERECYLAYTNSNWQSEPKEKSLRLYELGMVKQRLGKFAEAEPLLKESLEIEQALSSSSKVVGQRLIGLSGAYAGQGKWAEGTETLERLIPIATLFPRQDRLKISLLLEQYSKHLKRANQQLPLAKRFATTAAILSLN